MPTTELSPNPHPDHLRGQARSLQRAVRSSDDAAIRRIEGVLPGGIGEDPATFPLSRAQTALAREYGFPGWARLLRYVEIVREHRWDPPTTLGDDVDRFCDLACLTYSPQDGPERWAQARNLLAERPDLTRESIWAAATAADLLAVARLLEEDPRLARRRGGPNRWSPLFHLAYSRCDPSVSEEAVLGIARLLLDAGADPHEGYLWHGGPYAFTLLTGVFGEGEMGPRRQPRHPHSLALARLLLEAGADPADDQTLYNRQFREDDDHLALLLEHGLATGAHAGPWRDRMSELHLDPAGKLRVQLRWAIEHGFPQRVRLLASHDVDVTAPYEDGRTPRDIGRLYGEEDMLAALDAAGAPVSSKPHPADDLVGAAFRGDEPTVQRLRTDHPEAVEVLRHRGRNLLPWAAARGRSETIRILVGLGLDINALGRGDVPVDGGWTDMGWGVTSEEPAGHTALHQAAFDGNAGLIRALLDLGADPSIRDTTFHATPLGWAQHAAGDGEDRSVAVALLEPHTSKE